MAFFVFWCTAAVVGFAIGFASANWNGRIVNPVGIAAAALATVAFAALLVWKGTWAASCPGCTDGFEDSREIVFYLTAIWYGMAYVVSMVALAAGAVVGGLLARPPRSIQ